MSGSSSDDLFEDMLKKDMMTDAREGGAALGDAGTVRSEMAVTVQTAASVAGATASVAGQEPSAQAQPASSRHRRRPSRLIGDVNAKKIMLGPRWSRMVLQDGTFLETGSNQASNPSANVKQKEAMAADGDDDKIQQPPSYGGTRKALKPRFTKKQGAAAKQRRRKPQELDANVLGNLQRSSDEEDEEDSAPPATTPKLTPRLRTYSRLRPTRKPGADKYQAIVSANTPYRTPTGRGPNAEKLAKTTKVAVGNADDNIFKNKAAKGSQKQLTTSVLTPAAPTKQQGILKDSKVKVSRQQQVESKGVQFKAFELDEPEDMNDNEEEEAQESQSVDDDQATLTDEMEEDPQMTQRKSSSSKPRRKARRQTSKAAGKRKTKASKTKKSASATSSATKRQRQASSKERKTSSKPKKSQKRRKTEAVEESSSFSEEDDMVMSNKVASKTSSLMMLSVSR